MTTRTTRITVETETFTIIRRAKVTTGWCPECHIPADIITVDLRDSQVQDWVSTGKLHLWNTGDGTAQLCVSSLLRCLDVAADAKN